MTEEEERLRRRVTFDEVATLYDAVRPGYPAELYDDVVSLSGIPAGGRILEIGPGTGQATAPFARRGYRIVCIELGENMAAVARHNLARFPQVEVVTGAFEDWPVEEGAFDLVISATAFHWIHPDVRYSKTAQALKPGGAIALIWSEHVKVPADNDFFAAVQEVYGRDAPHLAKNYGGLRLPAEVEDNVGEIDESGLFGEVTVRKYLWEQEYDAEGYTRLLTTYSDHRSLPPDARERLLRGIAELIDTRYEGRITKGYLTTLYLAHRR